MTYELRIERLFDAPPEVVFETLVDPDAQHDLFNDIEPGWSVLESEIDLRVGGIWTTVFGPQQGEPDRLTRTFLEIDRPHLLVHSLSMFVSEWGRTVDSVLTFTFEVRDGKTLLTLVQSGFESEQDRDSYEQGTPGFLDALRDAVAARMTG